MLGMAPIAMSWVEARSDLGWRWIQWIQVIIFAVFLPFIIMIPETREGVILRRQAAKKRKEVRKMAEQGGEANESIYLARSELNKPSLTELLKVSSLRPICEYRLLTMAYLLILMIAFRAVVHRAYRVVL